MFNFEAMKELLEEVFGKDNVKTSLKEFFDECSDENFFVTEKDGIKTFVWKLPYYNELKMLAILGKTLEIQKQDFLIIKEAIEKKDSSLFKEMSENGKLCFSLNVKYILREVKKVCPNNPDIIKIDEIRRENFMKVITGELRFENNLLNEYTTDFRTALPSMGEKIIKEIGKEIKAIKSKIPEHLQNKQPHSYEIPLKELSNIIENYAATKEAEKIANS